MLYNMLKKLIERKYYEDKQIIIDLLNNFTAFSQITIEQYSELMLLVDEKYTIVEEETTDIENAEETEENTEIEETEVQ